MKGLRALSPGCKINDVFLAVIGGGLRRYLEAKKDLPKTSLTAMAPISVRSTDEKGDMGNQVAAMIVPLGTHLADPVARLNHIHKETLGSKAMTEALGARQMTEMSKVSPALFMALGAQAYTRLGLSNYIKPPFNTVVTNVPGPPVPIYSTGRAAGEHARPALPDRRAGAWSCCAKLCQTSDHRLYGLPQAAARSGLLCAVSAGQF